MLAAFWGTVAGFTSFVAHVGGPPFQVYTLPLRLDPKVLTGTGVIFFAVTNAIKLVPYFALGQFDTTNLAASVVLMPIAPLATLAGAWLVRRMRPEIFYPFTYATVALIAVKLLWDGMARCFDAYLPFPRSKLLPQRLGAPSGLAWLAGFAACPATASIGKPWDSFAKPA